MTASNGTENAILLLILNAVAWANMADNAGTTPATNLYVSLHTSDPGEAGDQTTNEIAYTSYARVAVARTSSGWTVSGSSGTNAAAVSFPAGTGGSGTATHFGVGLSSTGAGTLLLSGALGASLVCGSGVTPSFAIGQLAITHD